MLFTILLWMLWVLIGLLGLAVFLISMPYQLKVDAAGRGEWAGAQAWCGWPLKLLGLDMQASIDQLRYQFFFLGIPITSGPLTRTKKDKVRKKKKKKKKTEKKGNSAARFVHMARMPHKGHLLGQLPRWLFLKGTVQGRLGFSDPYRTGQAAAFIGVVQCFMPNFAKDVALDFQEPTLEGNAHFSMTVWLPRIAVGVARYALSRRGRAAIRHFRARPKPAAAKPSSNHRERAVKKGV